MITLRVKGEPAPQGSKSIVSRGGRTWMIEKSRKVTPWREAVQAAAREWLAGDFPEVYPHVPVMLGVVFIMPRPVSHYRAGRNAHLLKDSAPEVPRTRPDISKLIRSTEDAITDAGLWGDDGQVVQVDASKVYAHPAEPPGAVITIQEWKDEAR